LEIGVKVIGHRVRWWGAALIVRGEAFNLEIVEQGCPNWVDGWCQSDLSYPVERLNAGEIRVDGHRVSLSEIVGINRGTLRHQSDLAPQTEHMKINPSFDDLAVAQIRQPDSAYTNLATGAGKADELNRLGSSEQSQLTIRSACCAIKSIHSLFIPFWLEHALSIKLRNKKVGALRGRLHGTRPYHRITLLAYSLKP